MQQYQKISRNRRVIHLFCGEQSQQTQAFQESYLRCENRSIEDRIWFEDGSIWGYEAFSPGRFRNRCPHQLTVQRNAYFGPCFGLLCQHCFIPSIHQLMLYQTDFGQFSFLLLDVSFVKFNIILLPIKIKTKNDVSQKFKLVKTQVGQRCSYSWNCFS